MGSGTRLEWMDLLRGCAILLVVVWHAPAVPALYGYDMPSWLRAANDALLPYRMPMLMFLSGLLLPRALAKPRAAYYAGKVQTLLWPYMLWALLHLLLYGGDHPLWHPRAWIGTGYLWFLFCIMVYYFVAPLLPQRLLVWIVPLSLAASFVAEGFQETRLSYFAAFFFAGHFVARHPELLERLLRPGPVALWWTAAVGFGAVSALRGEELAYRGDLAVFGFAGVLAFVAAARAVTASPRARARTRWLSFVGRHSLVYYTSHFPIMIVVLHLLEAVGVHQVVAIAAAGLAASVALGTLAARWSGRAPVSWLFRAPEPLLAPLRGARRDRLSPA